MRERPILFSAPMIRAILDGKKTVTRRIYRPRAGFPREVGEITPTSADRWTDWGPLRHGAAGDRLWVRETWRPLPYHLCGPEGCDCDEVAVHYAADQGEPGTRRVLNSPADWRYPVAAKRGMVPAIHMPRWASRLTLEIVSNRVERLHDIAAEDVLREGVGNNRHNLAAIGDRWTDLLRAQFVDLYRRTWCEVYSAESWAANPYVERIEFRPC